MNDLSHQRLTFDTVFSQAVAAWPEEIRLPRRKLGGGRYVVEGLTELEDRISSGLMERHDAILLLNLHWAIATAVHEALGRAAVARPVELEARVRQKFDADLRRAAAIDGARGWTAQDLLLRDRYFDANAPAA